MRSAPSAQAVGGAPQARRHLTWVLVLARWLKAWAERVLAEHAAALAKGVVAPVPAGARVRSLPLREPPVTLLPAPVWPPRLEPSLGLPRSGPEPWSGASSHIEAPTPRLNTLRCIPREGPVLEESPVMGSLNVETRVPFGFGPEDLLPAEPGAVVAPLPSPAALLQAAALQREALAEVASVPAEPPTRPLQVVPSVGHDPARELLALLKESLGTPHAPSLPWPEVIPPSPSEASDAEEALRQCERLEWEPPGGEPRGA
jgi:hypothetical protein